MSRAVWPRVQPTKTHRNAPQSATATTVAPCAFRTPSRGSFASAWVWWLLPGSGVCDEFCRAPVWTLFRPQCRDGDACLAPRTSERLRQQHNTPESRWRPFTRAQHSYYACAVIPRLQVRRRTGTNAINTVIISNLDDSHRSCGLLWPVRPAPHDPTPAPERQKSRFLFLQ